jgi:hypothetical protein
MIKAAMLRIKIVAILSLASMSLTGCKTGWPRLEPSDRQFEYHGLVFTPPPGCDWHLVAEKNVPGTQTQKVQLFMLEPSARLPQGCVRAPSYSSGLVESPRRYSTGVSSAISIAIWRRKLRFSPRLQSVIRLGSASSRSGRHGRRTRGVKLQQFVASSRSVIIRTIQACCSPWRSCFTPPWSLPILVFGTRSPSTIAVPTATWLPLLRESPAVYSSRSTSERSSWSVPR